MDKEIIVSNHAFERWRQRKNLTYKISISKFARQGYIKGIGTEGRWPTAFQQYLNHVAKERETGEVRIVKVYKNYILVYQSCSNCNLLVTVFEIPDVFFYIKQSTIQKQHHYAVL